VTTYFNQRRFYDYMSNNAARSLGNVHDNTTTQGVIFMPFSDFLKCFLTVFLLVILALGLWVSRSILLLGFAAAVIAVGINIPANWLHRRGLRRGWAIAIATIGVLIATVLLLLLVLPQVVTGLGDLLSNVPTAIRALPALYETLRARSTFLSAALSPLPDLEAGTEMIPQQAQEILNQLINASMTIASGVLDGVSIVANILINIVFVLFIAIFFLIDPQSYVKASLFLTPKHYHRRVVEIWNQLYHTVRVWIAALSLSIMITAGLVWLILGMLLGMPNAVVVAVFAGIATFIPNIGFFLPLIPIVIFTLASDPGQLVVYVPVYLLIQLLESNVITPSIVKAELKIPAGGVMVFQLLATLALGALGLLLAVPLLAVITVLVREIYAYDLLGLRHTQINLRADGYGRLALTETAITAPKQEEVPVKKTPARPARTAAKSKAK